LLLSLKENKNTTNLGLWLLLFLGYDLYLSYLGEEELRGF
jgi:hypothetical protein